MTFAYDPYTRTNQRIIDALISGVAFSLAYQIRFEGEVPAFRLYQMWLLLPAIMLGRVVANSLLGVYRLIWRYLSLQDMLKVTWGYVAFSSFLLLLRLTLPPEPRVLRIPLSIIMIELLLCLPAALGARVLRHTLYRRQSRAVVNAPARRLLFIGAGSAGAMVANEMIGHPAVKIVGFLDDDPKKIGSAIDGIPILGPTADLPAVVQKYEVGEVIVCIARASRATLKRIWLLCENLQVRTRIIPTLEEILSGKVSVATFRDVQMSDLLARETVDLSVSSPEVVNTYRGRRILITGAGGSIGSELAHQLLHYLPERVVLVDKDENGLHEVYTQLDSTRAKSTVIPVVADVRFPERLKAVFSRWQPEVVFHAAAHKHVPLMELNPCEAILNNVVGTDNLVRQSLASGVSIFVLISTDKAVRPRGIMGASKRVCEMIIQTSQELGRTRFSGVRFGNVLGSRGSVVPLFQKQIANGGPVTVTHPEALRFLMTIPEAVHLVIQTGTLESAGDIFILNMGDPVPVLELARDMVELSGLRPDVDIHIEVTNLRPGEKLVEELFDSGTETLAATRLDKVWVVKGRRPDPEAFRRNLVCLAEAARRDAPQEIFQILKELNIGFEPATGS